MRTAALGRPLFVCIYRVENLSIVLDLLREARGAGCEVRLWCLDENPRALARWTVGSGTGPRLALLNRLAEHGGHRGVVVLCDDDVSFVPGDLRRLLRWVRLAGFDIAQPAHAPTSSYTHHVTARVPGSHARLTRFVEVGPVVVLSRRGARTVLPLPEDLGMGWGLDVRWSTLSSEEFRLGVIDEVAVEHRGVVGAAYDMGSEDRQLSTELQKAGVADLSEIGRTLNTWWCTSRVPSWRAPRLLRTAMRRIRQMPI